MASSAPWPTLPVNSPPASSLCRSVKLLEAFAAGIPVVSTKVGAEGLAVKDGEFCALADAPGEFAARVIALQIGKVVGGIRRGHPCGVHESGRRGPGREGWRVLRPGRRSR